MNIIFITGGVRSGKSAFAEQMMAQFGVEKQFYYIATGVAFDDEMKQRIARHRTDRCEQTLNWQTVEMQYEFPESIKILTSNDVILFECVTTWLSNVLFHAESKEQPQHFITDQLAMFQKQLHNWHIQGVKIVIVSNEILDEPASIYEEVNVYRKTLGELHQWIVKHSQEAYEVQFQLVQRWK